MYRFETIDLGEYGGEAYFLVGFVDPEPDEPFHPDEDADRYGVSVARSASRPSGNNVEVGRMDTAHGRPHLDREYLPSDADRPKKVWLESGYSYERMKRYLLSNWKHFAELERRFDESDLDKSDLDKSDLDKSDHAEPGGEELDRR